jgi:hypothetical protein
LIHGTEPLEEGEEIFFLCIAEYEAVQGGARDDVVDRGFGSGGEL